MIEPVSNVEVKICQDCKKDTDRLYNYDGRLLCGFCCCRSSAMTKGIEISEVITITKCTQQTQDAYVCNCGKNYRYAIRYECDGFVHMLKLCSACMTNMLIKWADHDIREQRHDNSEKIQVLRVPI